MIDELKFPFMTVTVSLPVGPDGHFNDLMIIKASHPEHGTASERIDLLMGPRNVDHSQYTRLRRWN